MDDYDGHLPEFGAPCARIIVRGLGVVAYGPQGRAERIWTRYGLTEPNPWLNNPLPNAIYIVGANSAQLNAGVRLRHVYKTKFDGSTECVQAIGVELCKGDMAGRRWNRNQCAPVGFPDGEFDRGHLLACSFGAGMESINLVTMPNSVNQSHRSQTAEANGHREVAALADRFRNADSYTRGTLTTSGEFALPNFRMFENFVTRQVTACASSGSKVSVTIRPITYDGDSRPLTDIIYTTVFLDHYPLVRYKIDSDLRENPSDL